MSRETKRFLRSTATVMVVLAMVFAFAIAGVRLFGLQVYGVLTGSMEPSYPIGSLVYVKKVDPATLKVSDVITFSMGRNAVATHRIVEKVPDPDNPYSYSFRTKGDANENADNALVRQSSIVGKVVFSLPMMGHIANYIQNPPGTYVAILVSLLLIAFVFVTDGVKEQEAQAPPTKGSSLRAKVSALMGRYWPDKAQPEANGHCGYAQPQQPVSPYATPASWPQQMRTPQGDVQQPGNGPWPRQPANQQLLPYMAAQQPGNGQQPQPVNRQQMPYMAAQQPGNQQPLPSNQQLPRQRLPYPAAQQPGNGPQPQLANRQQLPHMAAQQPGNGSQPQLANRQQLPYMAAQQPGNGPQPQLANWQQLPYTAAQQPGNQQQPATQRPLPATHPRQQAPQWYPPPCQPPQTRQDGQGPARRYRGQPNAAGERRQPPSDRWGASL